jgi:ribosome maturation protein SDO1
MNQHGKRFEIACYRNKILNYRQKIETDLSEVLQTDRVFTNVSKGLFAPTKDLQLAFGTTDQELICRIILDKGQIQVSDMERSATLENTAREIANMVATKCVHPVSNRPYTTSQIRDAMKAAEFVVQATTARSVKQQFLDCVKAIQDKGVLDIQRAKMELAVVFLYKHDTQNDDYTHLVDTIKQQLKDETEAFFIDEISNPGYGTEFNQRDESSSTKSCRIQFLIDPSKYRAVESITKKYDGITLEIVRQTVTQEGDVDVNTELERMMNNAQQQQQQNINTKSPTLKNSHDNNEENINNDNDITLLSNNIKSCTISNNQDTHDDSDEQDNNSNDDEEYSTTSSRKKNKQAQKKSKKAKRREKEEASLRQARIDAENSRREERESRLLASSSIMNEGKQQQQHPHPQDGSMEKEEGSCKSCNTCGGSFTPAQYRVHFRSDWHRYNIKLKMKGLAAVDEKEFLMVDSDAFFDDFS